MNFESPRKNYTGIALVTVLHLVAAGVAVQNSTVWINRAEPEVIDLLPPERPPRDPEPIPNNEFEPTPKDFTIAVDPPPIAIEPTQVPPDVPRNIGPSISVREGGGGGGGNGSGGGEVARPAPLTIAPVIDAANCTKPDYPKNALRNGDEGTVVLAFLIGKDGRVASAKVEQSSGHRELDRAAMSGLSLCSFKPGTVDGVPYESWTRMQYAWRLDQ